LETQRLRDNGPCSGFPDHSNVAVIPRTPALSMVGLRA
jgi:hypothetical protein